MNYAFFTLVALGERAVYVHVDPVYKYKYKSCLSVTSVCFQYRQGLSKKRGSGGNEYVIIYE